MTQVRFRSQNLGKRRVDSEDPEHGQLPCECRSRCGRAYKQILERQLFGSGHL